MVNDPLSNLSRSPWGALVLLVACYAVSVGWNFHIEQIKNPDEPRYVVPARHMARGDSDWLIPLFNGEPRTVKPILVYWLLAIAAKASLWVNPAVMGSAMRLVPILSGLVTVLATFGFARKLFGTRAGLLAGLVLTTTYYFHETTREIITDPLLTAFLTMAWYFIACASARLEANPSRTAWAPLLGAYLSCGLACLTKGPALIVVFVAIPMTVYLVWERKRYFSEQGLARSLLLRIGLLWGVPLTLLVGLSWHLMLCWAGQFDTVWKDFMEQNVQRAAGQLDKNSNYRAVPWFYYLSDLPGKFLPWAIFFIPAAWWSWRARKNMEAPARMLLCALGIGFLTIGVPASKRSLYLLPLYPMCATWIALVWDRLLADSDVAPGLKKTWVWLCGLVLVVACGAAVGLCLTAPLGLEAEIPMTSFDVALAGFFGLGLLAMAILALGCHRRGRSVTGSVLVLLAVAWLLLGYEQIVKPAGSRASGRAEFYDEVRGAIGDSPVVWLGGRCSEAVWYLDRDVKNLRLIESVQTEFFEEPGVFMVIKKSILDKTPEWKAQVDELKVLRLKGVDYALVRAASPEDRPPPLP